MKKILIIEDDPATLTGISETLKEEHFDVSTVMNGQMGYEKAKDSPFDLIILDLMLPEKNGIEICRDLRNAGINTPVLMLTGKKEEVDKIIGLEIGADDYVTKPFSVRELVARVNAILRRPKEIKTDIDEYTFADVHLNFKGQEAKKGSHSIELSALEFKVMKYFVQREGEVIDRNKLLDEVWGYENYPSTRTVDNFILNLRKKIEDTPSDPKHLLTIHGAGYKFVK
ncbi:MAG: response regulator transcription factor [Ignavibacteriota bacterium]|jgi:DNA-binding response OmpR family regulator|nr:MAG: DNA-binding response regulator [Chlorobiota bacterium]MBE7475287.1 response regulator transcription factor [Ignavibacteriales bacterium]MBL1122254.1 DNA-binding response regulator [Ignavibacteriota bacterium]MBV6421676.1 Transcriptional regulatory protein WalR [Ignavibacteriaceae bacterium]MCE7855409.1 DNA-binding response regulator [Ignavibacteria bacterium CHB3]MEB2296562.1 response regulator transcription factor [Ignavibacteria bacterium]